MIKVKYFSYTDAQWDAIRRVVRKRLDRDADQIERRIMRTLGNRRIIGMQSLRDRIEIAASLHIPFSAVERQTPGHKARVRQLTELRDGAITMRDDIIAALATSLVVVGDDVPHHTVLPGVDADMLDATDQYIAKLTRNIGRRIAAQRPQRIANASKAGRDRLWSEALSIWLDIGGKATGIAAAEFVVATSNPVFRKVREAGGHKTASGMPQNYNSVVEWLRLRAKAQQRAAVRRKAS